VIAELGLGALWLAAALALLQLVLSALGLGKGRAELLSGVRPVAVAQAVLIALSFGSLITLFLRSDMSVLLVAMNSHSAKPWLYKFAGTWGNHEGSMLLWVTVMGLAGALVALLERTLKRETHMATLGGTGGDFSLGFYAFLLFASNPFARLNPASARRAGPQSAVAGPRPRLPSPDALSRLCRPLGRLLLRGRRAADAAGRRRLCPRHAAMGAGRVDIADTWASQRAATGPIMSSDGAAGGSGTRSKTPRSCPGSLRRPCFTA
jgi:hypothetical protein